MTRLCAIYSAVGQSKAAKQTILSLTSKAALYHQHVRCYSISDIVRKTNTTKASAFQFNTAREIHALTRKILSVNLYGNCISTVSANFY